MGLQFVEYLFVLVVIPHILLVKCSYNRVKDIGMERGVCFEFISYLPLFLC